LAEAHILQKMVVAWNAANGRLDGIAPQAEGYYEQGPANLGNPTLSAIDLAPSLQPMAAADGRYTLVYDGALYNFTCWRSRILRNWHRRCRLKTPR
jgi:asparagine synthetase B (glutamine-hydrolysing)